MTMESHLYWCHLWLKILPASDSPHLREGAGFNFYRQETTDLAQPWSQDQSLDAGAHQRPGGMRSTPPSETSSLRAKLKSASQLNLTLHSFLSQYTTVLHNAKSPLNHNS